MFIMEDVRRKRGVVNGKGINYCMPQKTRIVVA